MALPVAVRRSEPIFSPGMMVGLCAAIGLMAAIVQLEIEIPRALLYTVMGGGAMILMATSLMKPEVPMMALTAYMPFSKMLAGDFGGLATALNLTNILMGIAIVGYVLRNSSARRPMLERSPLNGPVVIYSVLGAIAVVQGVLAGYGDDYSFQYLLPLKRWLTPFALYFLTYNIVRDKLMIKRLTVIMMVVVTMAALMAIKDYIDVGSYSSLEKSRVEGIAGQPNQLGAFFVYYMFLFPAFPMALPKQKPWWLLVPFLLCVRAIQVTFSRGALVAMAFGATAFAFFKSKALWLILVMFLVAAVANPWLLPSGIRYRIESTFQGSQDTYDPYSESEFSESLDVSAANRLLIWGGAIEMIKAHPLGVGYGAFPHMIRYYAPELRKRIDAHNSYLIIGAEMGLQTLLAFLWIVLIMFVNTHWLYRNAKDPFLKSLALGWLGGLSGLLMANMFGSRLHSEEISAYFWIISALIMRGVVMEQDEARASAVARRTPNARRVRVA